jgi:hypothetical protein
VTPTAPLQILSDTDVAGICSHLPAIMAESCIAYIETGREPGSFLSLIIQNDFVHAAGCADHINQGILLAYCSVLYNYFPSPSWGSKEKMKLWMETRRCPVANPE